MAQRPVGRELWLFEPGDDAGHVPASMTAVFTALALHTGTATVVAALVAALVPPLGGGLAGAAVLLPLVLVFPLYLWQYRAAVNVVLVVLFSGALGGAAGVLAAPAWLLPVVAGGVAALSATTLAIVSVCRRNVLPASDVLPSAVVAAMPLAYTALAGIAIIYVPVPEGVDPTVLLLALVIGTAFAIGAALAAHSAAAYGDPVGAAVAPYVTVARGAGSMLQRVLGG